jgi:hypothetical protein
MDGAHNIDDAEAEALALIQRAVGLLLDARRRREPAMQPLVTAERLAELLAVPSSAIEAKTREGALPCVRIGRWIRYAPAEVLAALREGRAR